MFTLFTAALDTLLYRYTGSEDILVGLPLADRDRPELQSVIGFLVHVHALRTRLSVDMTFRELFARVQKGVLDLYSHHSPPFDQVVSRVRPERNASYTPLVQVIINWRDRDQQLSFIGMDGLEVESLLAQTGTSKFDLTLMLTDGDESIDAEIEYSTDLFDEDRIDPQDGQSRRHIVVKPHIAPTQFDAREFHGLADHRAGLGRCAVGLAAIRGGRLRIPPLL